MPHAVAVYERRELSFLFFAVFSCFFTNELLTRYLLYIIIMAYIIKTKSVLCKTEGLYENHGRTEKIKYRASAK